MLFQAKPQLAPPDEKVKSEAKVKKEPSTATNDIEPVVEDEDKKNIIGEKSSLGISVLEARRRADLLGI